jgi:hypothetical protein
MRSSPFVDRAMRLKKCGWHPTHPHEIQQPWLRGDARVARGVFNASSVRFEPGEIAWHTQRKKFGAARTFDRRTVFPFPLPDV